MSTRLAKFKRTSVVLAFLLFRNVQRRQKEDSITKTFRLTLYVMLLVFGNITLKSVCMFFFFSQLNG